MPSPLSPIDITQAMVEALPTHDPGDTTSDLSSSYEAVALFCHACMVSLGFRLLGFSEEQRIAECEELAPRLPHKWNVSFGSHSFLYAHSQSSMQYVLKIDRMGGKVEVRALGIGDERIYRLEITTRDFISINALPVRIPFSGTDDDTRAEDRSLDGGLHAMLRAVFINEARMKDLADLLKLNIIQKILPGLRKEGYEEGATKTKDGEQADDARDSGRQRQRREPEISDTTPDLAHPQPYPVTDSHYEPPLRAPVPAADFPPPDWEDPLDINRPRLQGRNMPNPAWSPFNIGNDDVNPPGLGPHDPLRGSFVPGAGLPRPGHGGMHPNFDDPLFQGPGGGDEFDSQIPPGARYDPVGPGFPGFGRGGRGNNPFSRGAGGEFGGFGGGGIL